MKAILKPNHFMILAVMAAAVLAASLLVLLGLASEPARAITPAQENGKIAFVSNRDGDEDIYTANPDGTNVEQVTNTPAAESPPAWSPDGKRLAFARNENATDAREPGNWDIFVSDEDGTEMQITTDSGADYRPSWSPDGTKIVYGSSSSGNVDEGDIDLYVANSDGSGTPQQLTSGPTYEMHPAWSPDGTRIAYTDGRDTGGGNGEIYVMNADGSGATNLSNHSTPDDQPAWSPDSKQIAWSSYAFSQPAVEIKNADGSGSSRVLTEPGTDGWPAWSPDGTQIAFHSFRDSNAEIYLANADGSSSQPTNITNSATTSERFAAWQKKPAPSDTTPPTLVLPDDITQTAADQNGATVTYEATATDEDPATPEVTCDKASGSTFPIGTTTVNCSATDAAGNEGTGSFKVNVVYDFGNGSGGSFGEPVKSTELNQVKAGQGVPVKFGLGADLGLNIFATGYPTSKKINCTTGLPVDPVEETVTVSKSGLQYDPATGLYTYSWKTDKSWSGTCRELNLKLADGTDHPVKFQFK